MKLLELLIGYEWPTSATHLAQDQSGQVYWFNLPEGKEPVFRTGKWLIPRGIVRADAQKFGACVDYMTALIPRDTYAEASKPSVEEMLASLPTSIEEMRDRVVHLDELMAAAVNERADLVERLREEGLVYVGETPLPVEKPRTNWKSIKVGDTIRLLSDNDEGIHPSEELVVVDVEKRHYPGACPINVRRMGGEETWPSFYSDNWQYVLVKAA